MKGKKTLLWEGLNPGDPGALVVEVHGPVLKKRQCHQEPSPKARLKQVTQLLLSLSAQQRVLC